MSKKVDHHHSQYLYHASAYGIAGEFHRPSQQSLPMQATAILPQIGGSASHRVASYQMSGLVSFAEAFAEVGGSYDEEHDVQTSYAYATIEKLNIGDMLTADRVVSRMMVYSPAGDHGGEHTFDITGSYFENLKIAGHPIDIPLATGDFHQLNSCSKFNAAYKDKRADEWLLFSKLGDLQDAEISDLEERYTALRGMGRMTKIWKTDKHREPKDSYLCSAAGQFNLSKYAGSNSELEGYGGIILIPKFGVIRLAEVLINKHVRTLTMFRVDMCSTGSGSTCGCNGSTGGGHGYPG
jgi:hypothetical protein